MEPSSPSPLQERREKKKKGGGEGEGKEEEEQDELTKLQVFELLYSVSKRSRSPVTLGFIARSFAEVVRNSGAE